MTSLWAWLTVILVWLVAVAALLAISEVRVARRDRR